MCYRAKYCTLWRHAGNWPPSRGLWWIYKSYSRQIRWFNKIEILCSLPNNRDTGTEKLPHYLKWPKCAILSMLSCLLIAFTNNTEKHKSIFKGRMSILMHWKLCLCKAVYDNPLYCGFFSLTKQQGKNFHKLAFRLQSISLTMKSSKYNSNFYDHRKVLKIVMIITYNHPKYLWLNTTYH